MRLTEGRRDDGGILLRIQSQAKDPRGCSPGYIGERTRTIHSTGQSRSADLGVTSRTLARALALDSDKSVQIRWKSH